jgi:hypothetical protein
VALPLANNYSGGTNGVLITTGNSGGASGNAFDNVTATNVTFSNATPLPSRLMFQRIVDPVGNVMARWFSYGSLTVSVYQRCYLRISTTPVTNPCSFSGHEISAGTKCGGVLVTTAGLMAGMRADTGTAAGSTGVVTVPLNSWIRVEHRIFPSTTVGEIEWKWWSDPDSTGAPTDQKLATGLVLAATIDRSFFGTDGQTPASPFTLDVADVAASVDGWLGPSFSTSLLTLPSWPRVRYTG